MSSSLLDPFNMFGSTPSYQNPANSAMPYLQQIPGMITPYYQPYIDTGNQAMNLFFDQIKKLATPQGASDTYNQIASGYSQSPGTTNAINTSTQQTNQVAAASGMFGTPTEQEAVSSETMDLSYKDFNQYMAQVLGLYDTGLQGEQSLTELGYKSSDELASDLAKNNMSEAGMEFAGMEGQNKYNAATSQQTAQLLGALAGIALKFG